MFWSTGHIRCFDLYVHIQCPLYGYFRLEIHLVDPQKLVYREWINTLEVRD